MSAIKESLRSTHYLTVGTLLFGGAVGYFLFYSDAFATVYDQAAQKAVQIQEAITDTTWPATLDKEEYNRRLLALAHIPYASTTEDAARAAATTTPRLLLRTSSASTSVAVVGKKWPHSTVYPSGGAILPFKRIVAYYGNFFSRQMGVLGEYPRDVVLAKLASTSAAWALADPATPTIPAVHYIAVVAQGSATRNGLWIARMPDEEVDKALAMAREMRGLLFLDVQVGKSTVQAEIPQLEKYLSMPDVHLGIDPEFSMKGGQAPGTVIGTFSAADINFTINYLAKLVRDNHLPPKVFVVHRFTRDMITGTSLITPQPEVQVVIDMDGWGGTAKKIGTYTNIVAPEPVQFTGLKLFYHADLRAPSTGMLSMRQVLSLTPAPIYIQYQ
jgi:hypothetical protein